MGFVVAFSSVVLGLVPLVDYFSEENANVKRSGTNNDGFTDVVIEESVQV